MSNAARKNNRSPEEKSPLATASFNSSVIGPGSQIGHFRIERELGRGAMGVVYLAHDSRLDRFVAIKTIPPEGKDSPLVWKRWKREAQLLGSLNHPNIAAIYEQLEEPAGMSYLVLEYVPGQTLSDLISSRRLDLEQVLSIALQVANAVAAAHEKGVIHRDLKPGNIKITPEDNVKVLDFGLAKALGDEGLDEPSTTTEPGKVIGTPAYMSPEQARGKPTDKRSDIWSFGCILFEMLTGELPFQGETATDALARVLEREPDWRKLPAKTPASISVLLHRCLQKDLGRRLQHIGDAAIEISEALDQSSIALPAIAAPIDTSSSQMEDRLVCIAVLPFANMSADPENEYFSDGLAEELINALTQVEGLRVVARTSSFQFKGQAVDVREVGKRLNVTTVVEGSVRKAGNRLRVTAQLISVGDGYHLWSQRYTCELEDVFTIQDEISEKIVGALKGKLVGELKQRHIKRYTENVEAYNLYLQGRYHWNKRTPDGFSKAVDCFARAIVKDPNYAPAHAGLADCYSILGLYGVLRPGETVPKAKEAALKALQIDETLAEAHCSLGLITAYYEYDWAEAERQFVLAIDLDPNCASARFWYSWFVLLPTGRVEKAAAEARRALELDPLSPTIAMSLGPIYYCYGQYDHAVEEYRKALELDPNHPLANVFLGWAYVALGRYNEAITACKRGLTLPLFGIGMQGLAYARMGNQAEAARLLVEVKKMTEQGLPAYAWMANIYAGLGESNLAFECLERACDGRESAMIMIKLNPMFQHFQSDPRFHSLLRRMNLSP